MDLQWLESGEMPPEDLDSLSRNLAFHLKRLVDERDTQLEVPLFNLWALFSYLLMFLGVDFLMKIVGCFRRVMWKRSFFFPLLPQESILRKEGLKLLTVMDGGCVIVSVCYFYYMRH